MKILLIHNKYQSSSPSGEDLVFKSEEQILKASGIDVITFERNNDDIIRFRYYQKFALAFQLIWSPETHRKLKVLIKREKPDLAHFHNIFYLISPSAYHACKDLGIPVIQTLHNFRLFCVNGLLMKHGKICEDCLGKLPWRSVLYGCYRDSRFASMPITIMESAHRFLGTWEKKVDAYIALTEFGREKFAECGLPAEKIFVKPSFVGPRQTTYEGNVYRLVDPIEERL